MCGNLESTFAAPLLMPGQGTQFFFGSPARVAFSVFGATVLAAGIVGGYLVVGPVRSYDFAMNQKIAAASPLRLSFLAEMNHGSVEEHLELPLGLEVSKEWEGNLLVLRPPSKLEMGKTYVIRVDGRAKQADKKPLQKDLVFTFLVAGAPAAVALVPGPGAEHVPEDAVITIVFDRPMISLRQVQGDAAGDRVAGLPVDISPGVSGRWRWLGATTLSFTPDKGFRRATRYTVNVPPGLETATDEVTEKDFSWSFETERPVVIGTEPESQSRNAGPGTEISFTFNQEMDLISAKDFIRLGEELGPGEPRRESRTLKRLEAADAVSSNSLGITMVKYGVEEDEDGKKVTDKHTIVAVPGKPLEFEKTYVATVQAGVRGLVGDLGSASGYTLVFSTVGPLQVTDGSYRDSSITVDFTSPVENEELQKNMTFDPPVDLKELELSTYETGCDYLGNCSDQSRHRLQFYPSLEPSTKYTVTLKAGLKDIHGQALAKPFTFTFTTPALPAEAFIHPVGKSFSIFEAGKPPMYYLNAVNVSSLDLEFGRLSFDAFREIRRQMNISGQDQGADLKSATEGYREMHLKPGAKRNEWKSIPFDLEKNFGTLKPGIYAFSMGAPELLRHDGQPQKEQRFFVLTNMGLTLKYSGSKALVWVTDLQSGDPIVGATVKFHSLAGVSGPAGKTDKDGFFETPISIKDFKTQSYDWQPEFWVTAEKSGDFAFIGSDWNQGIEPYAFDNVYSDFRGPESPKYRLQSHLYTERPLYGAGDTVYFKGLVRLLDDKGVLSLPSGRSAHVVVTDPSGTQIYSKDLTLGDFGSFSDMVVIAKEAPLGYYGIQASLIPEADVEGQTWTNFSVLAYRKPEYRIQVNPEREDYFNHETAKVTVDGQYYFGAPMAGAGVVWRVSSTDYFFNKYTDGWYSFALEDSWCWYDCDRSESIVTDGSGVLDAAGRLTIPVAANIDALSVSQVYTVEADITDQNNQVVSGRGSFVVHTSNIYVGIRSDDYGVPAGGSADIKLVTLTPEGSPAPRTRVDVSLYSRKWNVIREKGVDGEYYYDSQPEDTFLRSFNAVTDAQGKATVPITLPDGGQFRVVAVAKDSSGLESKAGWSLYAWSDTYFNWPRSNNDRIEIVADKPEYKVGDTAKLLVKSPYQGKGVKALVTVERENIITKYVVDVESNALPIEVPITDELVPAVYVSVVIIKPRMGETFNEHGLDTGAPAFKIGYVKLPVEISTKKIDLTITTDKEKYIPGEKVIVNLETRDAQGKPVATELSLGVVDLSLLDLTGFSLPDIAASFYYDRGIGVQTANMLLYLMERFKPGSKGGGGGASEENTRGNFKDTAYWNPRIVTDENGKATASFNLPDNLTTWQLLGIGSTKKHLFGAFAKTIIETKRVIVRPVRPRFAVLGDKITLGAIVHNYLDEDRTFTVSLTGKGFSSSGKAEQSVKVPRNGQSKLSFPVVITDPATVTMNFVATTDGARDVIEETIPVYRFGIEQAVATAGVTEGNATEKIFVPSEFDAPEGSVSVSLAPSLAVHLPDSLAFLATFPYGCAEQTVSSFVPNIALSQLQEFAQFNDVSDSVLRRNIEAGLQKLYKFQRSDGGFGYWEGSTESYPYLSIYILHALKITKDAGYAVDSGVESQALSYLRNVVNEREFDPTTKAYALFVLSEFGVTDMASLNAVAKERIQLSIFGKAHLAMAYKKAGGLSSNAKAKDFLREIMASARVNARSAHFEEGDNRRYYYGMNTDSRTTAVALQALMRIEPDHELAPRIVRGMLDLREQGHWDTTQSTAQAVLAFVEYLKVTDELHFNYTAGVEIEGKKKLDAVFKAPALERKEVIVALSELTRGKEIDLDVGKTGQGRLYYDVLLSYFYTPDTIEPAEEGMGILRESKPLTKDDASMKVGTTHKVTLTITVPETRNFVAVESMLPAGMEPIDLQFQTSQKNLLEDETNVMRSWRDYEKNQMWRFSHIEYRDDRVFLFAEQLPPGVYRYEYLVRATTPGSFRERPAKVWEMYYPEVFGQTKGGWMEILP